MERHFARLHNAIDAAKAEAARLDGEIAALRRSIDDAGAPTTASELEAVAAEVRSLRSLLGARTAARSPAPSSAASQFLAPHAPHARPAAPGKGPAKPAAGAAARPGAPRPSIMAAVAGSPAIAGAPGAAALAAAVPAAVLDDAAMLGRIREALEADRVDILLQPIVSLPQRKHRYYEVFSRLRCADGSELLPEQYLPVAARENFLAVIDTLLLFRCFQLIRETERRNYGVGFVCNISTAALGDPAFMDQFVHFMAENPGLAPRLVFELPEAELLGAGGVLAGGLLTGLAG